MTRLHATAELRQTLHLMVAGLATTVAESLRGAAKTKRSEASKFAGRGLERATLAVSKLESGLGYWDTSG